jgi:hypothetical protein
MLLLVFLFSYLKQVEVLLDMDIAEWWANPNPNLPIQLMTPKSLKGRHEDYLICSTEQQKAKENREVRKIFFGNCIADQMFNYLLTLYKNVSASKMQNLYVIYFTCCKLLFISFLRFLIRMISLLYVTIIDIVSYSLAFESMYKMASNFNCILHDYGNSRWPCSATSDDDQLIDPWYVLNLYSDKHSSKSNTFDTVRCCSLCGEILFGLFILSFYVSLDYVD